MHTSFIYIQLLQVHIHYNLFMVSQINLQSLLPIGRGICVILEIVRIFIYIFKTEVVILEVAED